MYARAKPRATPRLTGWCEAVRDGVQDSKAEHVTQTQPQPHLQAFTSDEKRITLIALIALAGSVLSTIVTVFGAPALQARRDAKKALDTYREPLLAASYELQARLYNILQLRFVEKYISDDTAGKRNPARRNTGRRTGLCMAGGPLEGSRGREAPRGAF